MSSEFVFSIQNSLLAEEDAQATRSEFFIGSAPVKKWARLGMPTRVSSGARRTRRKAQGTARPCLQSAVAQLLSKTVLFIETPQLFLIEGQPPNFETAVRAQVSFATPRR